MIFPLNELINLTDTSLHLEILYIKMIFSKNQSQKNQCFHWFNQNFANPTMEISLEDSQILCCFQWAEVPGTI